MRPTETKTDRISIRWPSEVKERIQMRAERHYRSMSSEVRELLTYARNTIEENAIVEVPNWKTSALTSVALTPSLRNWLCFQASYYDRPVQSEILRLVVFALDDIMERELALLSHWTDTDQAEPAPE